MSLQKVQMYGLGTRACVHCVVGCGYDYSTSLGLRTNVKRALSEFQPSFFEEHGKYVHVLVIT